MGITFNLELNNRPTRRKTYTILLRITQNKKHTRKKTSVEVKNKSDFNPKAKHGNWIRTSEPNHKAWNEALGNEIEQAKNAYRDLISKGSASKELIKYAIVTSDTSPSFLDYAKQRATDIYMEGGYRNYKKYNGFCNKLESYLETIHKKDLLFSELSPSFLAKFQAYLHSLKNARNPDQKLHPSTISLNLRIFKTLINKAVAEKIIKPEMNPFTGFSYTKTIPSVKEKLNESEIRAIEQLDLPLGSVIWHCRNYFLFSFYMAGIRAGDLIQLRWNNITPDGRLEYRMGKTKKDRSIKLHTKALDILKHYHKDDCKPEDYIFPLLDNGAAYAKGITEDQKATMPSVLVKKLDDTIGSKNALINKYLKKIAEKAGIQKNVSFHISRHSFAKIAKDRNVDSNHLKSILGHSSIKITENYMGNFETQETDAVMSSIFETPLSSREKIEKLLSEMELADFMTLINEIEKQRKSSSDDTSQNK